MDDQEPTARTDLSVLNVVIAKGGALLNVVKSDRSERTERSDSEGGSDSD